MKPSRYPILLTLLAAAAIVPLLWAASTPRKILFFTKSSGYEHEVISWKKGKPSHAEKVLLELGAKNASGAVNFPRLPPPGTKTS